jgi:hypothetical protein
MMVSQKEMRMDRMEEGRRVFQIFTDKLTGKQLPGRPRCR